MQKNFFLFCVPRHYHKQITSVLGTLDSITLMKARLNGSSLRRIKWLLEPILIIEKIGPFLGHIS